MGYNERQMSGLKRSILLKNSGVISLLWLFGSGRLYLPAAFMPLFYVSMFKRDSLAVGLIVFGHIGLVFVSFELWPREGTHLVLP